MLRKSPFTILLISVNFIVYIILLFKGVNFLKPDIYDLIDNGANFNALVSHGEYWRLISSMFLHAGLIHLLVNMSSLLALGVFTEKKLGYINYLVVYFLSGIVASLTSDYCHAFNISVGASGAIMGIAGTNLAIMILDNNHNGQNLVQLKNLIISIIATLIIGFVITFIDNAAHIGGLVFGFAFTLVTYSSFKNSFINFTFGVALVISSIIIAIAVVYTPNYSYRYYIALNLFNNYETMANNSFTGTGYVETNTFLKNIKKAETNWHLCNNMLSETKNLVPSLTSDINSLRWYASYKSRYYCILYKAVSEEEYQLYDTLEIINSQIAKLMPPVNMLPIKNTKKENFDKNDGLKPIELFYDSLWESTTPQNASFYRMASVDSLGRVNGRVTDYFKSGHIQMKGIYFNDLQQDVCRYYFENGNYDAIGKVKMDERIGKWKYFYDNGQIKREIIYGDSNIFFKNFWTQDGNQTVKNGNGVYLNYYYSTTFLCDSGEYLNGYKEGIWKGYYIDGKPCYKELYKNGKLIKGISISRSGDSYYYTTDYIPPQLIGTTETYNEYLKSNLVYPPAALKNKTEGVLIIDISVDSSGTKTKIKPVNKLPFGCTEEAMRLVNHAPAFTPAFFKGQPIASLKRVYVNFRITN